MTDVKIKVSPAPLFPGSPDFRRVRDLDVQGMPIIGAGYVIDGVEIETPVDGGGTQVSYEPADSYWWRRMRDGDITVDGLAEPPSEVDAAPADDAAPAAVTRVEADLKTAEDALADAAAAGAKPGKPGKNSSDTAA